MAARQHGGHKPGPAPPQGDPRTESFWDIQKLMAPYGYRNIHFIIKLPDFNRRTLYTTNFNLGRQNI